MTTIEWWEHVYEKVEQGILTGGFRKLLQQAADIYPGSHLFNIYIGEQSKPDHRNDVSGNIDLKLPKDLPPEVILQIIEAAKKAVLETGGNFVLNLGQPGSSRFNFSIENVSSEQVDRIVESIQRLCTERGVQALVTREPYNCRDYYTDPLTAEGPDGQRFALDQVRASTPVRDVARAIINRRPIPGRRPRAHGASPSKPWSIWSRTKARCAWTRAKPCTMRASGPATRYG